MLRGARGWPGRSTPGNGLTRRTTIADDLEAAVRLVEEALHLRVNGERAPGGTETWHAWERKAERFLRDRLAEGQPEGETAGPA